MDFIDAYDADRPGLIEKWARQYAGRIVEVDLRCLPPGASKLCYVIGFNRFEVVVRPSFGGWRALDEVQNTWVAEVFSDTTGYYVRVEEFIGKYPILDSPIIKKDKSGISHFPHKCPRCKAAAAVMFNTIDCSAKCH